MHLLRILLGVSLALSLAACASPAQSGSGLQPQTEAVAGGKRDLILATTTSTQDSGLLDVLVPRFEESTGYRVKPVAVGTGQALELGQHGEADVLLVHSPEAEREFMETGAGAGRELVMYNDFVLVGPPGDPADIRGSASAADAMRRIAGVGAVFVSRGDDSGTHKRELDLWERAGVDPGGEWYEESGTGMGQTLRIASEKRGYTLTDRATFLAQRDTLDLEPFIEGDPSLLNIYHVIPVNAERFPEVNAKGAEAWSRFLLEPETQELIGEFRRERYGESLFTPCANNGCGLEEKGD